VGKSDEEKFTKGGEKEDTQAKSNISCLISNTGLYWYQYVGSPHISKILKTVKNIARCKV
jgi:hypothetical protein